MNNFNKHNTFDPPWWGWVLWILAFIASIVGLVCVMWWM